MNNGAIKFSYSKWVAMGSEPSIQLMMMLNENLEPGYTVYNKPDGNMYFVGDSDTLFYSKSSDGFHVYHLEETDTGIGLSLTRDMFYP